MSGKPIQTKGRVVIIEWACSSDPVGPSGVGSKCECEGKMELELTEISPGVLAVPATVQTFCAECWKKGRAAPLYYKSTTVREP